MSNIIRTDFVFSYWIFTWFLLYILKIVSYSPKLAVIIGIVDNLLSSIYLYIHNAPFKKLMKYLFINTAIKAIPLWFTFKDKIHIVQDSIIIISLFSVYLFWLWYNSQSLFVVYSDLINNYLGKSNGKKTLISYYFDKVFNLV
jgi:hypothetical protein